MANENATRFAKDIVEDLNSGYQYYKDPQVLADLLHGKFGQGETNETATEVANAILADWQGAKYYDDPEILAQYLESKGLR
jgi:hypothetical protein